MNKAYLIGGVRTPIGKTCGWLKDILPEQLASVVLNETISRCKVSPSDIDQVILGNAVGPGGNIARVSVLEAGWPYSIPAITIDLQCGSGLSAVNLAISGLSLWRLYHRARRVWTLASALAASARQTPAT